VVRLGTLEAHRVDAIDSKAGPQIVLVHGFGLGAWMWERDQGLLAQAGHTSWAVNLPGHGADVGADADFDKLVSAVTAAVSDLESPTLVGHGGGALVAQVVAERTNLSALVLMNPLPPGNVKYRPDMVGAQALIGALPSVFAGRVEFTLEAASSTSLAAVPEGEREAVYQRISPWPSGLARSLVRRPEVTSTGVPTLVLTGLQDHVVPSSVSRLVGDFHNAVTWRFDDVGHLPPLEPTGTRVVKSLVGWLADPQPRRVLELNAFQPGEGVGDTARAARMPEKTARSSSRFLKRNQALKDERRYKGDDPLSG
jgi:pimeloyl-ACP methyl ester carboxylesterase